MLKMFLSWPLRAARDTSHEAALDGADLQASRCWTQTNETYTAAIVQARRTTNTGYREMYGYDQTRRCTCDLAQDVYLSTNTSASVV